VPETFVEILLQSFVGECPATRISRHTRELEIDVAANFGRLWSTFPFEHHSEPSLMCFPKLTKCFPAIILCSEEVAESRLIRKSESDSRLFVK
jgi:hypothetical protein